MNSFEMQTMVNTGPFIYIMVRYATALTSKNNLWKLVVYLLLVFFWNLYCLLERYAESTSIYKSVMITLGYFAGVFVVAYFNKRATTKKVNIGSDKK
jgi:hypothetical protein